MPFRLYLINKDRQLLNFWCGTSGAIAADSGEGGDRSWLSGNKGFTSFWGSLRSPMVSGPGRWSLKMPCPRQQAGLWANLAIGFFLPNVDLESRTSQDRNPAGAPVFSAISLSRPRAWGHLASQPSTLLCKQLRSLLACPLLYS